MNWQKPLPELEEILDGQIDFPNVEKKKMFGCPAWFVNGNMFTGVFADTIFFRLSEREKEQVFAENDEVGPFEPMAGRVMKEYVAVPESCCGEEAFIGRWLQVSLEHTQMMPPKQAK